MAWILVIPFLLMSCAEPEFAGRKDKDLSPSTIVLDGSLKTIQKVKLPARMRRLVLLNEAVAYIGGEAGEVHIDEVISENGAIRTFPEGESALLETSGQDREDLDLRIDSLKGNLEITISGEKGGRGRDGLRGSTGATGGPGKSLRVQQIGLFCDLERIPRHVVPKGKTVEDVFRLSHPGKGEQGSAGDRGAGGEKGFPGGASGNVTLKAPFFDLERIKVKVVGGAGGDGGKGGPGGYGGAGGPGGSIKDNNICGRGSRPCCKPTPQGEEGNLGQEGPEGAAGEQGVAGKLMVNGKEILEGVYP